MLGTDRTWALISWFPPSFSGGLGSLSKYAVLATPQPSNQSTAVADTGSPDLSEAHVVRTNSTCVEFRCEPRYEEVPADQLTLNLTGLVPALSYSFVVFAFSNGSSLQSDSSEQVAFSTKNHGEYNLYWISYCEVVTTLHNQTRGPFKQGRIQELKGGGAEVKYLQRENYTLRHSHFGVIWL